MGKIFAFGFDSFAGAGFAPGPAAGRLDSDIFRLAGFGDSIPYGGAVNSGDLARGFAGAAAFTEGAYDGTNGADRVLIVQATVVVARMQPAPACAPNADRRPETPRPSISTRNPTLGKSFAHGD